VIELFGASGDGASAVDQRLNVAALVELSRADTHRLEDAGAIEAPQRVLGDISE
jgi:hypothetical protein